MRRLLLFGLLAVAALLLGVGWWVGSTFFSSYAAEKPLPGLRDSTTIQRTTDGIPILQTERTTDALAALGYVHGRERGWTAVLWRQTALGRLSEWFGSGVVPLDRHARRLGLARHAREAFSRLPSQTQTRIRAYSRGMTAALETEAVRESAPFTLLDVQPSAWKPWHTLLTHRLLAWLATPALTPPEEAPAPVRRFCKNDRQLRRWLHLHGWSRSVAWAIRSPTETTPSSPTLFQRHVLGASAAPIVQEVIWDRPAAAPVTWATLPGTVLFPTGTNEERAWTSLLRSRAQLRTVPFDSTALRHWYERLEPAGEDEQLLRFERIGTALPLAPAASPQNSLRPDTTSSDSLRRPRQSHAWVVEWPGFTNQSDGTAWLQRGLGSASRDPDSVSFSLFQADGLRVNAEGRWTVLGTPAVVNRTEETVLVGQSAWAREQSRILSSRTQATDTMSIDAWSASDSSAWAASLFPHLQSTLRQYAPTTGPLRNATTYLRNWDFHYGPQSIGALIFDQWMRAYRAELGHVPTVRDTAVYFARYRQERALGRALDSLARRLGPDVRTWMLVRVVSVRRYFPVWSADSLVDASLQDLHSTRYAPLVRTGHGHPSTLTGGPSLVDPMPIAPSPDHWDAWMRPGTFMTVRRSHFDPSGFFARSRVRRDSIPTHELSEQPGSQKPVLLIPASPE